MPGFTWAWATTLPSCRRVTGTSPAPGASSSTWTVSFCASPTTVKLGACSIVIRRSVSPLWPVRRAWSGAGTALASLGTSCTSPSVSATTAPSRERSVSARAWRRVANSVVPSRPSPARSTSRSSRPGVAATWRRISSSALAACSGRSWRRWLGEWSLTSSTMSSSASRCSRRRTGLARAASSRARKRTRQPMPRARRHTPQARARTATAVAARRTTSGRYGAKTTLKAVIGRGARARRGRGPGRSCSCRSGRTSRG